MVRYSSLSDSDEEVDAAVEELISQAKDLHTLEQVSKINTSGINDLPLELESRFTKLKSFSQSKTIAAVDGVSGDHSATKKENEDTGLAEMKSTEDLVLSPSISQDASIRTKSYEISTFDNDLLFMSSPSPPQKGGCFWCSPKKALKQKRNQIIGHDSVNSILKQRIEEEEKLDKEAEKLIEKIKQASARWDKM